MESKLAIRTASGNVPLDMEFLPDGLFALEISGAIERNQDSVSTLHLTDSLPKPRLIRLNALKRFTTVLEREEYITQIKELVNQAEGIEYDNEIGFWVGQGWVNYGFSPSRILDTEISIVFSLPKADFTAYFLDGVFMFRDDILMSDTDVNMSTLRY